MKYIGEFIVRTVVGGVFVVVPAYLAFLLLLKGMQSAAGLVGPVAALMPGGIAAQDLLSLTVILLVCFIVGVAVSTRVGRAVREQTAWLRCRLRMRTHEVDAVLAVARPM